MSDLQGRHTSIWLGTTPQTQFPTQTSNINVDVAIIGGGITGMTAAVLLKEAGLSTVVLEANRIIEGVTGFTTAKVTAQHDIIYHRLATEKSEEHAAIYAGANQWALEEIARRVETHSIDCDFYRDEAYACTADPSRKDEFKQEAEMAARLGFDASYIDSVALPFEVNAAVRFGNQARFHPRKYLLGLTKELSNERCLILEQTRAVDITEEDDHCMVETERGFVSAKFVILAAHFPFYDKAYFSARLRSIRSYALAAAIDAPMPEGMYINVEDQHSLRKQPFNGADLLIIGGEDHQTGAQIDTNEKYAALEKWAREKFKVKSIEFRWATQDNFTPDGMPFIGKASEKNHRVFVATGFGGWGMTTGTYAAKLMVDLILGRENRWADFFKPDRFKLFAEAKDLLSQGVEAVKGLVGERLHHDPSLDEAHLQPGEAGIFSHDQGKVVAYRDSHWNLHVCSAVCTHMGCIVQWNSAEQSWDCPCHGSRFNINGEVLQGPAVRPLKKIT